MKRSLEIPVAENARRGRTYVRDRIYRTPVGPAGGPEISKLGEDIRSHNQNKALFVIVNNYCKLEYAAFQIEI